MRVLVACEYSGAVRDAFRDRGHDAMSCDLLPTDKPGPHHQGDVREVLDMGWDLMIAHPPCTYLCSSGLHWNKRVPGREQKTREALDFVRFLLEAPVPRIALENPVGRIGTAIRKADQTVQPWQFGHHASKATSLWLKGLQPLRATCIVLNDWACPCGFRFGNGPGAYGCPNCEGTSGKARAVFDNQTCSGQNKLGPSAERWKLRSETFEGIARAMAEQWGTA